MTQDALWLKKYQEVKAFIETNHRNPSRHNPEERFKYCNWLKHNKKLLNAGEMKEVRWLCLKTCWRWGKSIGVRINMNNRFFTCFWARLCELIIIGVFEDLFSEDWLCL